MPCRDRSFVTVLETRHRISLDGTRRKPANPGMILRFLGLAGLWVVLDDAKPAGLLIGLPAAAFCAWVSMRLRAPGALRVGWMGVPSLVARWAWDALLAGFQAAWLALHPRLTVRSGFVRVLLGLPSGQRREALLALSTTLPGSLPVEDQGNDGVLLHCLDARQDHAGAMAALEVRLREALAEDAPDA